MTRSLAALRIVLPSLWLGLLIGLAFIEAPLKFQAPGITTPLGLGIGRLVFFALETASWILLAAITVLGLRRPRAKRGDLIVLAALWVTMVIQVLVIRPPLNARSDVTIAGGDPGESWLHYGYIVTDVVLLVLLIVWIVRVARSLPLVPPVAPVPRR